MDFKKEMSLIKLANIVLYFSQNCANLGLTKLNKLLYYLDIFSLKETGKTATGQDYKKFPQGPVPEVYNRLRELLDKSETPRYHDIFEDYIKIKTKKHFSKTMYEIIPKGEFDPNYLSNFELKLIESIAEEYGQLTAKELSNKTHKENPWKLSEDYELIDLKLFFKDKLSDEEYLLLVKEERLSSAISLNYA